MGFFKDLFRFRRKKHQEETENWEEVVYVRDSVNFHEEEQRSRYVTNCLEQIADAAKEINLLTGEYNLVTGYLTDVEEIEALPENEKDEIDIVARRLLAMEQECQSFKTRKNRLPDEVYYQIRAQEDEVEDGIRKLQEAEHYGTLIKQDLRRLDGERHAYDYRRQELEGIIANLRGMAVIFLTALAICILMLVILQFGFEMNTYIGYLLSVFAAAIAVTVLCVKYTDADKELISVKRAANKIIQLQNKVKIRYVNNTNLLDYLYMKYNTDSAGKLEKRWTAYQQEKEERKQYAEAQGKIEYYEEQLVSRLSRFRVKAPERWIRQAGAFLDKREMVEIRHELILRRQALRKQLEYNNQVAAAAQNEIKEIAELYPMYAGEIMEMVDKYDKR